MPANSLAKSAILMSIVVIISVVCWELFLRSNGYETTYYDDPALWSDKRAMVYEPSNEATVFIGSSRIKFDLDIPTWEAITGDHAIQLACVGSNPIPILHNLADDEKFKGKMVIDVTEPLFFSGGADERPVANMKYYKEQTPAQRVGFQINRVLESQFVFLDHEWLSLGAKLDMIPLPNRPGVFKFSGFPSDFGRVKFNRQEYLTNKMAGDTSIQNIVKNIWASFAQANKKPPASGTKLDSMMQDVKKAVDKITARGGEVIFVRTPSSGRMNVGENKGFPKEKYWDVLLAVTQKQGIYFKDYPALANMICPDDSHLSLADAKVFTINFIEILKEKGWKFPNSPEKKN